MLAALRTRVGSDLDRVDVLRSDLNEPISLGHPVDAVFSVATLHWLPDHARVFRHIARTLRRGGQFVSECGGEGNIATVSAALTAILGDTVAKAMWNFAEPESTRARLEQAGFTDVEVDLAPDLVAFADTALLETYLETVVLGSHLEGIPTTQRAALAKRVAAHLPQLELDYVRLRIKARKRVNTAD
jgi:trans-aconitate 2-methyltransferase